MIRILFAAGAAAALVQALPAMAAAGPREPAAGATPAASPSPTAEKRYCVVDTVTGSRIPEKVCKTRKQWIDENQFDPLNP